MGSPAAPADGGMQRGYGLGRHGCRPGNGGPAAGPKLIRPLLGARGTATERCTGLPLCGRNAAGSVRPDDTRKGRPLLPALGYGQRNAVCAGERLAGGRSRRTGSGRHHAGRIQGAPGHDGCHDGTGNADERTGGSVRHIGGRTVRRAEKKHGTTGPRIDRQGCGGAPGKHHKPGRPGIHLRADGREKSRDGGEGFVQEGLRHATGERPRNAALPLRTAGRRTPGGSAGTFPGRPAPHDRDAARQHPPQHDVHPARVRTG